MTKVKEIKPQENQNNTIIDRIKTKFNKFMDQLSAKPNPDNPRNVDNPNNTPYYNTNDYWENRKRTEEIAATQAPFGDKGIER